MHLSLDVHIFGILERLVCKFLFLQPVLILFGVVGVLNVSVCVCVCVCVSTVLVSLHIEILLTYVMPFDLRYSLISSRNTMQGLGIL